MPRYINVEDALQAHPEFLNEKIDDHDKAIYAKGWNDCNKEYYNAISELPVASIDCTDLSMRLRRAFEADELTNHRLLLDAADAIEELLAAVPQWVSVEERLPEFHMNDSGCVCTGNIVFRTEYKTVHLGYAIRTVHNIETVDGFEQILMGRWYDQTGDMIDGVTHWMPLTEPPQKGVE